MNPLYKNFLLFIHFGKQSVAGAKVVKLLKMHLYLCLEKRR